MPNNVYRFRRIKWGAPKRFKAMPPTRAGSGWRADRVAIVIGLVVIGAVLTLAT